MAQLTGQNRHNLPCPGKLPIAVMESLFDPGNLLSGHRGVADVPRRQERALWIMPGALPVDAVVR
ncbi:hypothetical protein ACFW1M_06100 [Streptomyces inhibens]|uniref:hypothetical protein n=1 Tax=Streptomyces inhibens TaxID=2293571 RepID=UPI003676176A